MNSPAPQPANGGYGNARQRIPTGNRPATELFELQASVNRSKTQRADRKPAAVIKKGSVRVVIYGRGPYTIAWRDNSGGARKRAMRSELAKARSFAEEKATTLANGETWRLAMGQGDYASYLRAREILIPTGKSLELAAAEFAEAFKRLPQGSTIADAVKSLLENSRANIVPKSCPEIVDEFLDRKRRNDFGKRAGTRWLGSLGQQLRVFANYFKCPLQSIRSRQLDDWIRSIDAGGRTRKNYLGAIGGLVSFAKIQGYLRTDWNELQRIPVPQPEPLKIVLYTPDEMVRLLGRLDDGMIPFVVCAGFAGIRHAEMNRDGPVLDWKDVDFENKIIRVKADVAKTKKERLVKMSDNLVAWLRPHARPAGPVCTVANTSNALCKAKRKAGIKAGRNETRNSLRKSFISYSTALGGNIETVSGEAGNSQAIAQRNYLIARMKKDADRWFAIRPDMGDGAQKTLSLFG